MNQSNGSVPTLQSVALAFENGHYDSALKQCQQLLAEGSSSSDLLHLMALCQRGQGDLIGASRTIKRAIKKSPKNHSLLNSYGLIALDSLHLGKAVRMFRSALALKPDFAAAHANLGHALVRQHLFDQAKQCYYSALKFDRSLSDAFVHLALLLRSTESDDELESLLSPDNIKANQGPGLSLVQGLRALDTKDFITAERLFRKGLEQDSTSFPLAVNLGVSLSKQNRKDEARHIFSSLLESHPNSSELLVNLADTYKYENHSKTREILVKALEQDPQNVGALDLLGFSWMLEGMFHNAIENFDRALTIDKNFLRAKFHKACALFLCGNLKDAWPLYLTKYAPNGRLGSPIGEAIDLAERDDLEEESTLIWTDQGIGDEILQLGLAAQLDQRGADCTVMTSPRLTSLVKRSFTSVNCVSRDEVRENGFTERFSKQCPAPRLGLFMRERLEDFPNQDTYLNADTARVEGLVTKYKGLSHGQPIIGLSWNSANADFGSAKSIALSQLTSAIDNGRYVYLNLQYGDTSAELSALPANIRNRIIHDPEIDPIADLDAHAAQIMAVDLVISISNSTAHLAGALGQETWVMVPRPGPGWLWYWFYDRTDSPWYPSVTLFRQPEHGEWSQTLELLRDRLADLSL